MRSHVVWCKKHAGWTTSETEVIVAGDVNTGENSFSLENSCDFLQSTLAMLPMRTIPANVMGGAAESGL